jgi:hypothetical protein
VVGGGRREVDTPPTPLEVRARVVRTGLETGWLEDGGLLDVDGLDGGGLDGGVELDGGGEDSDGHSAVAKKRPLRMPSALASTWAKHLPGTASSKSTVTLVPKSGPTWKLTFSWCAGSEPAFGSASRFSWMCSRLGAASGQPCPSWTMSTTICPSTSVGSMLIDVIVTLSGHVAVVEVAGGSDETILVGASVRAASRAGGADELGAAESL